MYTSWRHDENMKLSNRVNQIIRCMDEIAECRRQMHTAHDPLLPLMGQMDYWLTELHFHIHNS